MRFLGLGPATLLVFLISYSISHGNRIDPAGIKGNFVLSAEINNQDAIDEFTRLGGEDSNIFNYNFLEVKIAPEEWKFDVVIGNPPFNYRGINYSLSLINI